jgi:DNA-directed RNA polymerase subunit M/transcription elongation factor TFIIS
MAESGLVPSEQRAGVRASLGGRLAKVCAPFGCHQPAVQEAARALEEAIYARTRGRRRLYMELAAYAHRYSDAPTGLFPDDLAGVAIVRALAPAAAAKYIVDSSKERPPVPPRERILRLFVGILAKQRDVPRGLVLDKAAALEKECYNTVVRRCKAAEDPPLRNWESPAFRDLYGDRCGAVAVLLDPESATNRTYNTRTAEDLLLGALSPRRLGAMSTQEACPQATEAEREEIAKRSAQKVVEKESSLFKCPFCGERRSTYRSVQTRALDEAGSFACLCRNERCGRRFTGHS